MTKKIILPLAAGIVLLSCTLSKKTTKAISQNIASTVKSDTTKKDTTKKLKPYNQVITSAAITQNGLFKVHKVDERWFLEIADSLLNRDILIVNRINKAAEGVRALNGMLGYAGDYIGENLIRFEKGPDTKLFIKRVSYLDLSKDSSENGMYRSVSNSSFLPIVASFEIKTHAPDSSSSIIDITDYLKADNDVFFFNPLLKKQFGLGALQADKSYIEEIKSFPLNTEIRTVKTYLKEETILSYELNSSIVLLPLQPMTPRYFDQRVGYFARGFRDFDFPQAAKATYFITRWKMEPKEQDIEKYQRGETVEPKKPIVFYIDPATPKKWVPFLIKGVNAWQKAFEKAGFKNAIYALEAPTNDSTWSLDDARHNVIVYKSSFVENASGPQISDPRSGEILESHINWYHNIQQLLHDWYFIQASPNDPAARKMEFDDSLMGKLITYVCTHEVGHTLGLQHNFIASSTIPVDSLRSKRYVAQNGHTSSIMDYARFNYVAQPEDSIAVNDLIPRIGVYDEWAIEWGYKWIKEFKSRNEEKTWFNKWTVKELNRDPRLFFAPQRDYDFRNQMEDLGDDAIKAGYYGIKNLKLVLANFREWASMPNQNYADLVPVYRSILNQYGRYLGFVMSYIGQLCYIPKTIEQSGPALFFQTRQKQKAAIQFLNDQLFDNTGWLDTASKQLFPLLGGGYVMQIYNIQEYILNELVKAPPSLNNLLINQTTFSKDSSYSYDELLKDLEAGIWKELDDHKPITIYRRAVQKTYVAKLIDALVKNRPGDFGLLEPATVVLTHINNLYGRINQSLSSYRDQSSVAHLKDVRNRLKAAINDQKKYAGEPPALSRGQLSRGFTDEKIKIITVDDSVKNNRPGCWDFTNDWLDWEKIGGRPVQ